MKNTNPKYKTVVKLVLVLAVLLIGIVAVCDFTPSPQPKEVTIPFTR